MQHEEQLNLAFRRFVTSPLEWRGVKGVTLNWNNIWNDLFWDTCASEDILVEYIAYWEFGTTESSDLRKSVNPVRPI